MTAVAEQVKRSDATKGLARFGLVGHGILYVLIGVLALSIAFGTNRGEADQHGALQQLAQNSAGMVVLVLVAIGLSAYALWLFTEAAIGSRDEAKERASAAVRGVLYAATAVSAWEVVAEGRTSSQSQTQQAWTGRIMQHTGGRWLVGIIGLAVIGAGGYLAYKCLKKDFEKHLDLSPASPRTRSAVLFLGQWGGAARGVVVGVAGVLLLVAAINFEPKKASGFDGALRTLRNTAVGPWLLVVIALGLVLFGLYGVAEGRYRRI